MYCTLDCLAPGNTPVPQMTTRRWRPTDVPVPRKPFGWLITAWDDDGQEYGRIATVQEMAEISAMLMQERT